MKVCIEPILVQSNIIKILHDARNDLAALSCYFKVNVITKVFDSSKIYFKLTGSNTNGLHTVYEEISGLSGLNLKPRMRMYYMTNDAVWEERPLRSFFLFYAAMDVLSLISIYLLLDKKYTLAKWCPEQIYTNHVVKERSAKVASSPISVQMESDMADLRSWISERGCKSSIGMKVTRERAEVMLNGRLNDKPNARPTSKVKIDDLEQFKAKVEWMESIARGEAFEQSD